MLALQWPAFVSLRRGLPRWLPTLAVWGGTAGLAYAAFGFTGTGYPGTAALVPTIGTALLLASGDVDRGPIGRLLASRPMIWIGDLSYSLYLWHWPMLVIGNQLIDDPRVRTSALLVLASFIPAWLSFRWIEDPIRSATHLHGRRVIVLAAICVATPGTLSLALYTGSSHSWWNPDLARWEELRTQEPVSRAAGCHTSTSEDPAPLESCTFGDGEEDGHGRR